MKAKDTTPEPQPGQQQTAMAAERRVLIVDDDVDFAESLRDLLEEERYRVEIAHDARAALTVAEAFAPHVALLDIRLRGGSGNGLDLLGMLTQRRPGLLCLVMTAYADTDTAIRALQGDAYDYLRKPLYSQELVTTLNRCFETIDLEQKNQLAAAALRTSEERYRSIFENALEGIFRSTPEGGLTDVNPALVQMLGYSSKEQVLALNLQEHLYADLQELRYVLDQLEAERAIRDLEVTWKKRDGESVVISLNSRAVLDAEGRVSFHEGMVQDITARKRAENALRAYAERLETLRGTDTAIIRARSPDEIARAALGCIRRLVPCLGTCVVTLDFGTREAVLLAADIDGEPQTREAGTSSSLEALGVTAGVLEKLRGGHSCMLERPSALPHALVQQPRAGVPSAILAIPLIFQETLLGFLSLEMESDEALSEEHAEIIQEVANQLAVAIENARLLEAERRRGAELEALHQASLHLTSSLEQQSVLEAIVEHALALTSADNVHIFLYDGASLAFGAAMWAGGLQHEPYAVPRPEGLTHTVARTGAPIVIPEVDTAPRFRERRWGGAIASLPLRVGGEVCGVMNIAFEKPHAFGEDELNVLKLLADQAAIAIHNARLHQQVRQHADELAAALARQQELDRLKDEFIQNVSHELRSPLAIIRGYAEMLDDGELGELHADQQKPVATIARRSRMLGELVEDITLILEARTRPLERQPVSLGGVAQVLVEDFQVAATEAGLTLGLEIAGELPPVSGSPTYLRRVLDNLLSNAIKFTLSGGTVEVRVRQEGEQVLLQVQDTGVGIPEDQLARIFERFYQVDGSARRRYGGVGLGLALVKEIVELHGGQVSVESQVGVGSTFTVTLPVYDES